MRTVKIWNCESDCDHQGIGWGVVVFQILIPALLSLTQIYPEHNRTADQLRQMQVLSVLAEPTKMSSVPTTEVVSIKHCTCHGSGQY